MVRKQTSIKVDPIAWEEAKNNIGTYHNNIDDLMVDLKDEI